MHEVFSDTKGQHGRHSKDWHADVKFLTRPELKSETPFLIAGIPHYKGVGGKVYVSELFDKYFSVKKGKVRAYNFKGTGEKTLTVLDQF